MSASRLVTILSSLGLLDWSALAIGWNRGWATRADVAEYALSQLELSVVNESLSEVAKLTESETLANELIGDLISSLADTVGAKVDLALDKWRLARLLDLDSIELQWDEKVTKLEEVAVEFGYPSDMRLCTRYGPSEAAIEAGIASRSDLEVDPLDAMKVVIVGLKQRLEVSEVDI